MLAWSCAASSFESTGLFFFYQGKTYSRQMWPNHRQPETSYWHVGSSLCMESSFHEMGSMWLVSCSGTIPSQIRDDVIFTTSSRYLIFIQRDFHISHVSFTLFHKASNMCKQGERNWSTVIMRYEWGVDWDPPWTRVLKLEATHLSLGSKMNVPLRQGHLTS